MEDFGFLNRELLFGLLFVGGLVLKVLSTSKNRGDQEVGDEFEDGEIIEEFDQNIDKEDKQLKRVVTKEKSSIIEQKHTPVTPAHDYDYNSHNSVENTRPVEGDGFSAEDFDLRQAVIMSEILQPKFKDE